MDLGLVLWIFVFTAESRRAFVCGFAFCTQVAQIQSTAEFSECVDANCFGCSDRVVVAVDYVWHVVSFCMKIVFRKCGTSQI